MTRSSGPRYLGLAVCGLLATGVPALATGQVRPTGDSATIALGPEYQQLSGLRRLRGHGWRQLWGTELRLPVITAAGMQRPAVEPGSLAGVVTAWSGTQAFRILPVNQDPVRPTLPVWMWNTTAEQFLRDLVSTALPTAPLAAVSLYHDAGLEAIRPALVIMERSDSILPDLRALAGQGVWLEPAPELEGGGFGRFDRVVTTDTLEALRRLDPTLRIDFRAFLAARLLDIVIGDPNRGPRSWLWGLAAGTWVPIATRQEQAFLRADGTGGLVLSNYQANLAVFAAKPPDVRGLTTHGYDLDRPFLARLDRATWDSVAVSLQAALGPEAIDAAIKALPAEHRALAGDLLREGVAVRRDHLPQVVAEYYRLMTTYPDIELSDGADSVTLTRAASGDLTLQVRAAGQEVLQRVFRQSETEEVRLHLLGGADHLKLEGMDWPGVAVRITGSGTGDVFVQAEGSARRVVMYDEREEVRQDPADAVRLVPREVSRKPRWTEGALVAEPPDWGVKRSPIIEVDLTSDLGVVVGGGMSWTRYGFDQPNYRQRLRASAAYATRPAGFRVQASFERRDVLRGVHLTAVARASAIDVVRFFGYGNESPYGQDLDYYRVEQHIVQLRALVGFSTNPDLELKVGPVLSMSSIDTSGTATLVATSAPYGSGEFQMLGLEALFNYTPDRARYEQGFGFRLLAGGRLYPELLDVNQGTFGGVDGEARVTWSPRPASRFMLATRLGGRILRGTVPFTMTARVGGPRTVRGYESDRFAGDLGSAYGSLELRARVFRFRMGFLPADFGLVGFGDGGRVWAKGESSSTMHWSAGGGIWVAPSLGWISGLDQIIGRVEVAVGPERTSFYVGTGFRF